MLTHLTTPLYDKMTIRTRIAYGYVLVLGIALSGTIVGLVVGNHYQRQALADRQRASLERQFFNNLQIRIHNKRPVKNLSPHLGNRVRFQLESQQFLNRLIVLQRLLRQHHILYDTSEAHTKEHDRHSELHHLFVAYEGTITQFLARTKTFIQAVNALEDTRETTDDVQQLLLELVSSSEFQAFTEFPEQLAVFAEDVEAREQAAEAALAQAEVLRMRVILVSLLVAAIAAGTIAFYTSRAIARPLQVLTEVARQVTEEENFDLRAPDEGTDEIGVQTKALNQLIERVQKLPGVTH